MRRLFEIAEAINTGAADEVGVRRHGSRCPEDFTSQGAFEMQRIHA
jgi:hypothetical protein